MVAMVTRLETVATVVDMSKRLSWCEGNANNSGGGLPS